jgi:hypothetical protein
MKIVKDDENKDPFDGKGNYMINSDFTMIFLAKYKDEESCQKLI